MKWVEIKMRELRVSNHPAFKLTALMDHSCMVTIHTARHGAGPSLCRMLLHAEHMHCMTGHALRVCSGRGDDALRLHAICRRV
jgi:hypothetical protein